MVYLSLGVIYNIFKSILSFGNVVESTDTEYNILENEDIVKHH